MANTSKIRGFVPVKHATGAPYNGQANIYAKPAAYGTALFVGDPVVMDGSAHTNGVATIAKAGATTGGVTGVVVGFINAKLDPVSGSLTTGSISLDTPQYSPASTFGYVLVCDAPDVIYEVEQTTGSNASYTYLVADVGQNVGSTTVAGSTSTGASGSAVDMSTKNTTATLPWKILGTVQRIDNEAVDSSSTSVKLLVKINNATLGNGTGATGL
jgi:hypothetical protein